MTREEAQEADKNRPVIVHCIGLLILDGTKCAEEDAMYAAWRVWKYLGEPTTLAEMPGNQARQLLRRAAMR